MADIKNRRINKSDIDTVEKFIKSEFDSRKTDSFRVNKERIWKEVDRQIAMETMQRVDPTGKPLPKSWHSVFELGELSKASEIITADIMRICFPKDEFFECHVEVPAAPPEANGQGPEQVPEENQRKVDGVLRSLMVQQHLDFGMKARVELSVKEALHHGSYGAVVKFNKEMMVKDGSKIKFIGSPVWQPYSMWNTYPDPSPSVIPSGMFYTGSMIFVEYLALWRLKKQTGDGWMSNQYKRIKEDEKETKEGVRTKECEMVHYYGDLHIDRKNDDSGIFLPNCHVITANGVLVYYAANDLPFSPVIFDGYERQDIRDPYHNSPLIKQSPMQKITTVCANKFLDAIALEVEPPGEYDGSDPDYVLNGGPVIAPGAQTPTRSIGKGWKTLDIKGSSTSALEGMQMGLRQMQEGTGVSAIRSGIQNSDRQTATEVNKTAQGAEVRTVDFVSKLENRGLRPFLYMQHELNRLYLDNYTFYNDEMNTPDFMRASKDDIDHNAHFDIVGSRGILGEEQRTQRIAQATVLFSGNPLFAPLLRPVDIMLDVYKDAGKKNPEEYVKVPTPGHEGPDPRMQAMQQAIQQKMQEMQQAVAQKEKEVQAAEQAVQKKSNDLALKEISLKKNEELLALKKQMDQFQTAEKAKREQVGNDILSKQDEIMEQANTLAPVLSAIVQSIEQSQKAMQAAMVQMAQLTYQGNQLQAEVLKAVTSPRKVTVTRTATGLEGESKRDTLQ